MTAVSTVNPLRVAIIDALDTIATLSHPDVTDGPNKAHSFHEGDLPRGATLPWVVLGAATETEDGSNYQQPGNTSTVQVKCWAEDSWAAQELYNEAKGKLHGVVLTVTGHRLVKCQLRRLTDFAEPNPEVGGHVVIGECTCQTLVA